MYSGGRRRKSSSPATLIPPSHPPEVIKTSLRPDPSVVAVPPAFGPPCGGIHPTPNSYAASGLMSLTRIAGPIVPLPSKSVPIGCVLYIYIYMIKVMIILMVIS